MNIILASKSPRRQELLKLMGMEFSVEVKDTDESFPPGLSPEEIAVYISGKKAKAFDSCQGDTLVITADTIVAAEGRILGKPADEQEAREMLQLLSGKVHKVITGVTLLHHKNPISFYDTTLVHFRTLSAEEIDHYIHNYKPYDKAGAYGIQEWIGYVAVKKIEGSYTNVMGLPTEKLYQHITHLRTR